MRAALRCLVSASMLLGFRATGHAQDPRLTGRLDPAARDAIVRIVDSARAAGLPVEPLIDKALEGAAKGASGERIVTAVGALATRLSEARAALGTAAGEAELVAGADALRSGVPAEVLTRVRGQRSGQSLAVPLATLSDLIALGVPADTAAAVVLLLTSRGAADADFLALRQAVGRDVGAGRAADRSAPAHAREALPGGARPTSPPPPVPRP